MPYCQLGSAVTPILYLLIGFRCVLPSLGPRRPNSVTTKSVWPQRRHEPEVSLLTIAMKWFRAMQRPNSDHGDAISVFSLNSRASNLSHTPPKCAIGIYNVNYILAKGTVVAVALCDTSRSFRDASSLGRTLFLLVWATLPYHHHFLSPQDKK